MWNFPVRSLLPLSCLLLASREVGGLEPFSAGLAVGGGMVLSALWSGREAVLCQFKECCQPPWVKPNITKLEESLQENVFGQHIVANLVPKALRAHLKKKEPQKALVISFHGWTGAGKNFVSRFIAESLFAQGLSSSFVHLFISTLHFPHADMADVYRLRVQDWIRGNVTKCAASLFIFDEVDKMPVGMIDGIKPFIDHHTKVEGVDFRRSIFLFLSNTGGRDITREALKVWEGGRERESLEYTDLEHLVNKGAFNELGGLHHSSLIDSSLIDVFLPFLPLERRHVRLCVEKEASRRNISLTSTQVGEVADSLVYWPADTQLFSTTGCKRVANKLDLLEEALEEENVV